MEVPSQSELNVADDHAAIAEHRVQVKIPETLLSQFRSLRGTKLFLSSLSTAPPLPVPLQPAMRSARCVASA